MIRTFRRKARVSLAVFLTGLMVPVIGAGEELDWTKLRKDAPPELIEMAMTKRPAVFFTSYKVGLEGEGGGSPFLGFFISGDGLALCPLEPLCQDIIPKFLTGDHGDVTIKTPTVLAIFAEEGLALVKFAHKPKVVLTISKELAPLGTWVAILTPPFGPVPTPGPILAHRRFSFHSKLKVQREPKKGYSIGVPSIAAERTGIVEGAPIVDAKGEVVAVQSVKVRLPSQTFTMAYPTAGLTARIEEAVKEGRELKVPIPINERPLDPLIYSKEYLDGTSAEYEKNYDKARECAKAVVAKFPDSRYAKLWEYMMVASFGLEPEVQVELAQGLKMPENAPPWERGMYCWFLGESLRVAGKTEEAILSLQKSDELYPDGMASMRLTEIFQNAGRLKEAERYARQATSYEPDRIEFWDALQQILFAQGNFKEADKLQDRIYLLEHFY